MMAEISNIEFSLGYNFDKTLIERIKELNCKNENNKKITEFYGAMPFGLINSARPDLRIPNLSWSDFGDHVEEMRRNDIRFNYLLNAKVEPKDVDTIKLRKLLNKLYAFGISDLIVFSPNICSLINSIYNKFEITISSVYSIRNTKQLDDAEKCGAKWAYVDSIYLNRNFKLLRKLIKHSKINLKIYANVSCLSMCSEKDTHYTILSNNNAKYQIEMNKKLFNYCSREKLRSPVKWIQMQWIRPEDICDYVHEGFKHFKLADRLAPTEILLNIAECYVKGRSPDNLFPLIERDGVKYRNAQKCYNGDLPFVVSNKKIPNDFVEHFKSGDCYSTNEECEYCNAIAKRAIKKIL